MGTGVRGKRSEARTAGSSVRATSIVYDNYWNMSRAESVFCFDQSTRCVKSERDSGCDRSLCVRFFQSFLMSFSFCVGGETDC